MLVCVVAYLLPLNSWVVAFSIGEAPVVVCMQCRSWGDEMMVASDVSFVSLQCKIINKWQSGVSIVCLCAVLIKTK